MESEPIRVVDCLTDAWWRTHDIIYVDRALEVMDGLSGAAKTNLAKRLVGAMPETHDRMAEVRAMAGAPLVERLCTDELQSRIDAAGAAGGGEVCLEAGEYVTGTLWLRSGVTLRLGRNAVLKGSRDYSKYSRAPGKTGSTVALLQACGVTNVAIVGEGVIDGNGLAAPYRRAGKRWKVLYFNDCKGVRVEGVKVLGANSWTMFFDRVEDLRIKGIVLRSRESGGSDGLDIRARNVLIEDCDIDAEDDGVVLKNPRNEGFVVENVTVRNCTLSSECNAFQIGTETAGDFRNITVEDVKVIQRGLPQGKDWTLSPGCSRAPASLGIAAFSIATVDGGAVENVTIRRCSVGSGYRFPFRMVVGARNRNNESRRAGRIRNVLVEDVDAVSDGWIASSTRGIRGNPIEGMTFRRVSVSVPGGALADESWQKVPEKNVRGTLPAYGLYARHVNGLVLDHVNFRFRAAGEDRPPVVTDDVKGFEQKECSFQERAMTAEERRAATLESCRLAYFDEQAGSFSSALFWCPRASWHITGWGALYSRAKVSSSLVVVSSQKEFLERLETAKREQFALLCAEDDARRAAATKWWSCFCSLAGAER